MKMRHVMMLFILACATLLFSHPALAQFSQQGPKLVGAGAAANSYQGWSVAISGDGNTIIATGSPGFISMRSGSSWIQQYTFDGGNAVALSYDGNTAIVGPLVGGGAAIFTRSGGDWTQRDSLIYCCPSADQPDQGQSVALSGDGNTAIIGGPGPTSDPSSSYQGAAWIFTRSGGVWSEQHELDGFDATGGAQFGASVGLSFDGNTAIVGGPSDNNGIGAAWIFARIGGAWSQQGLKLVGSGGVGIGYQGMSVALSSDGNTGIVGGPADNNIAGAAWVYAKSSGVWNPQGPKLVSSDTAGYPEQGISVALSGNGDTAIIGGPADDNQLGATWAWTRSGSVWGPLGSKLVGTGGVGNAAQGRSVSLSSDGSLAIVGGPYDNNKTGAVWFFSASSSACNPPVAFGLSSPSNGFQYGSGTTTATLQWGTSSGASSYDLYFGTTSNPSLYQSGLTGTAANVSVSSGQTYYWKVVSTVSCNSGYSQTAGPWSFSVSTSTVCNPPGSFGVTSPSNGSTGVSSVPTLTWNASSGAGSYEVHFGTSQPPPFFATTGGTSYQPGALQPGVTYYWSIYALASCDATKKTQDSGGTQSFTTAATSSGTCVSGSNTLCLNNGRFRVQVAWQALNQGTSGNGQAVPMTSDTGYFWFFSSNNIELVIKVLDGTPINGHFWVFYGALSNVQYTITVTDTQTGAVKTYFNPQNTFASAGDTSAFAADTLDDTLVHDAQASHGLSGLPRFNRADLEAFEDRRAGYSAPLAAKGNGEQVQTTRHASPAQQASAAAPTISSISPNSGPTAGGNSITIFGKNLQLASSVTFGGASTTVNYNTTTGDLQPTAPPHAAGAVNVTVTTPGGTVTSTNGYTYLSNASSACVPGADTLCLNNSRFRVQVAWRALNLNPPTSGTGQAVPMTSDTGYFWFFSSNNVELIIKVLDGRPVNGRFWVFYGALSNVQYTITVTDTQTGAVKTYFNPQDTFASAGDTAAF